FGIDLNPPQVNFLKIQERKQKIVSTLRQGMQFRLKDIDFIASEARFTSSTSIKTSTGSIDFKSALIASGSIPFELPAFKFDNKILSSDSLLELDKIPASLLIIGGGVIGCEFASLFSSLGTKVTIVEKLANLLPTEDIDIAKKLENTFKKKGVKVLTGADASTINLNDFEKVLVSVGRKPFTEGLGLEEINVKTEKGKIIIDDFLKTSVENIYAAGDCTAKIMLAHFAAYQGELAIDNIKNSNSRSANNTIVPNCIFTDPQISSVGLKEEEAKKQNIAIDIKKFDFLGSGMARIIDETDGFLKLIIDKNGRLLGASIIGPGATELIATLTIAIKSGRTIKDLRST
ncbi:MAG: FAD-dependent oxidoreductase, partial [Candidatus Omnitrophica bacterium]|nr:FAD-dependent oxidoreductase [Candidatus Omnitrophota bacterium]